MAGWFFVGFICQRCIPVLFHIALLCRNDSSSSRCQSGGASRVPLNVGACVVDPISLDGCASARYFILSLVIGSSDVLFVLFLSISLS